MIDTKRLGLTLIAGFIFLAAVALSGGCNKEAGSSGTESAYTILEFGGTDVNKDGTLSAQTLDAIQAKSAEKSLKISFIRTPLGDAGLAQLEKFKNIRRVEAIASKVTAAGIAKLKKAIPEVEVAS